MSRLAQSRRLTILRDDHIGEPLGGIFLDPSPEKEQWTIDLLRSYLGSRVRIRKAELRDDRVDVDVELHAFCREADQLAGAARDLHRKGARRAALALFNGALELDPLNHPASSGKGLLLLELERYAEALQMLKRARETGPESVDVLFGLGLALLKQGRTASAIVYLESVCAIAPDHFGARRALAALGRKPTSRERKAAPSGESRSSAQR